MGYRFIGMAYIQFFLVLTCVFAEAKDATDARTAAEILARMIKTYTSCNAYQDSGNVQKKIGLDADSKSFYLSFRTAFVRNDRLRFEYVEKKDGRDSRYIIWTNGKEVLRWWDVKPKIENDRPLKVALFGANGVSEGSSYTIPSLLVSDLFGNRSLDSRLVEITEAKRMPNEKVDDADCFRIEGKLRDATMTVWIDVKSFLVRLIIITNNDFLGAKVETRTSYNPMVDAEVPDKALEFDPPKPK